MISVKFETLICKNKMSGCKNILFLTESILKKIDFKASKIEKIEIKDIQASVLSVMFLKLSQFFI